VKKGDYNLPKPLVEMRWWKEVSGDMRERYLRQ
jgi:hypothetical protein